jgi:hypothetical protein
MGFPETMPYFEGLVGDQVGNLWVRRYQNSWAKGPQYWDVYDQEGSWIALVAIPEGILPWLARAFPRPRTGILEIGDDYLLLLHRDSLGVRSVSRYRLSKEAVEGQDTVTLEG